MKLVSVPYGQYIINVNHHIVYTLQYNQRTINYKFKLYQITLYFYLYYSFENDKTSWEILIKNNNSNS